MVPELDAGVFIGDYLEVRFAGEGRSLCGLLWQSCSGAAAAVLTADDPFLQMTTPYVGWDFNMISASDRKGCFILRCKANGLELKACLTPTLFVSLHLSPPLSLVLSPPHFHTLLTSPLLPFHPLRHLALSPPVSLLLMPLHLSPPIPSSTLPPCILPVLPIFMHLSPFSLSLIPRAAST